MSTQALLPYYWILPVSGLAGFGLGMRFRVPVAAIASALFAAVASYATVEQGGGWLTSLAIAVGTLFCLQAGYFIGALFVHR